MHHAYLYNLGAFSICDFRVLLLVERYKHECILFIADFQRHFFFLFAPNKGERDRHDNARSSQQTPAVNTAKIPPCSTEISNPKLG
jgi:hypothetical protein